MSIFSKVKSAYQKATKKLQSFGKNVVAPALSKVGKQPAAVGMAFPVTSPSGLQTITNAGIKEDLSPSNPIKFGPEIITVPQGFSVGKDGRLVKDTSITGLQGGDIQGAIDTGQYGPRNIYSNSRGNAGNSVVDFGPVNTPSTLSSSLLAGGGSSGGSISLPSGSSTLAGGAIGALAGIKAAQKTAQEQADKYDPMTGELLTDKKDKSEDFFQKYLDQLEQNQPPSTEALYEKAQRESAIMEARQNVNNYQAQLNTITAQAEADQLSVTGQGRGIPEPIILGQQSQIAKEAAIKALPIAAQLSAAQGNLQLAEQHLETRFSLLKQDAQNKWEYKNKLFGAVYEFATAQEKKRIDQLKTDDDRQYEEHQDFLDVQNKLLLSAVTQNAPSAIRNAITSATNARDVIAAAGAYGAQIPKATGGGATPSSSVKAVFTNTQLNTGANKAGVTLSDFNTLPPDVQNYFVNTSATGISAINNEFASVKDGTKSVEEVSSLIDSSNLAEPVKTYWKSKLAQITPPTKSGGFLSDIWDGIKSLVGL